MAINLHLLRLFFETIRSGGFSRAGETLNVSQPAVSRGVRELELRLGHRLLDRGPDGVRPTEAGRLLLDHATRLFAAERAAEEDLAALGGLSAGVLRVGASTTIATWYLPDPLARFHAAHPGVAIRIRSANTATILDLLLARELDAALVEGPVDHPAVTVLPWRTDRLVWIAGAGHPLAEPGRTIATAALADAPMIVREPGSGTRDVARAALDEHRLAPREVLEVSGTEAIKRMVAAGIGIALVSEVAVRGEVRVGELVILAVADFAVSRALSRLRLSDHHPTRAAIAFDRLLDGIADPA